MHTYMYTYLHTYMHTCMHTCINTYIHAYTYTHTHIHTYIHTYILHTYICLSQDARVVGLGGSPLSKVESGRRAALLATDKDSALVLTTDLMCLTYSALA